MVKSTVTAYLLCVFTGIFGGHHFYLGRKRQGILYACSLGCLVVGVIVDLFLIPRYIREANTIPHATSYIINASLADIDDGFAPTKREAVQFPEYIERRATGTFMQNPLFSTAPAEADAPGVTFHV
eukprot:gnl/Chilomastix_cuspidata/4191.p1 GENE.gnl/Chilomastix_cuspidata/4191~~gnl/Chilomastix_cuspidata/4191.p1  ORF type:complete len:126 (-),score=13.50 gnl/Chilomastix_cuspidata/4191:178-555(-)